MQEVGVVLTGGGARAAYQVGVLRAISDMFPTWSHPFRVIVGTSAGAINALALAGGGDIFRHNVSRLERLWAELASEHVYRSNSYAILRNMTGVARRLLAGGGGRGPLSMLDNSPLHELLDREVDFAAVRQAILKGDLSAVGVNVCGYATGQNVCFFDGHERLQSWSVGQRAGSRTELKLAHVMASSAIPTVFPPVLINREYFGDGVTRQMAHISPALRLGAERVLVVGVSANSMCPSSRPDKQEVPAFSQIIAHVFNGMFLDTLDYDIDRLRLLNQLVDLIPPEALAASGLDLKPIRLLEISPSERVDEIAAQFMDGMPLVLRNLVGGGSGNSMTGGSLASYLLFDRRFSSALIELGYKDAQSHARQIDRFFNA
ncbi:patatin-like phospholipase family protein [Marinobacter sp. SS21]|uniref:patatin-like phospholipase family protein n=1 Tax=Marinobacter sp. SS21 TaxID=2979460 RepID=UPI00232E4983|nr:patatin-like phospholipase family protein [Marinobacter sp. SS21]MDC0662732.1 patatin-like phospholipase family protein [Marinobacter sp. SS21]